MEDVSKDVVEWRCSEREREGGNSSWVTVWQDSRKDPSPVYHPDASYVTKREEEGATGRNHNMTVILIKLSYNASEDQQDPHSLEIDEMIPHRHVLYVYVW